MPVLTPKERMVYDLMSDGKTSQEIASITGLTLSTIKQHRKRIALKLWQNVQAEEERMRLARKEGLAPEEDS